MGTTGFYFEKTQKKFNVNINSIKIECSVNNREILYILQNFPLEKYFSIDIALLLDSCPLYNPLHTIALHLTTIVIHFVE